MQYGDAFVSGVIDICCCISVQAVSHAVVSRLLIFHNPYVLSFFVF